MDAIQSTIVTKETLVPDLICYVAMFDFTLRKLVPCNITIIKQHSIYESAWVIEKNNLLDVYFSTGPNGEKLIYPGDRGVPGYAYDKRVPQLFTTYEACEEAIIRWKRQNPNLIYTS